MKSVVVLGGAGFIGNHVLEALTQKNIQVTSFDRHIKKEYLQSPNINMFLGDINNREAVSSVVSKHDGVINLAGILGTAETVDNPYPSVETNILGALNFAQACREHHKPGVQISVGNYFMNNSYAITKTAAERFCLMYNQEHNTKITIVRGLNAYGPGQKHKPIRKITPNFVLKALRGEPIEIFGSGRQIMDMIWVKDLADILVRSLTQKHNLYHEVISAGTGRKTTVNFIAKTINKLTGNKAGIKHLKMRSGEPKNAVVLGDPSTLKPLYGYKKPTSFVTLTQGLRQTINWYQDHYPWQKD